MTDTEIEKAVADTLDLLDMAKDNYSKLEIKEILGKILRKQFERDFASMVKIRALETEIADLKAECEELALEREELALEFENLVNEYKALEEEIISLD